MWSSPCSFILNVLNRWHPATIAVVHADGTLDVNYDAGDHDSKLPLVHVTLRGRRGKDFTVGRPVISRYMNSRKFYGAKILTVNGDGTYDVQFDEGECVSGVNRDWIRHVGSTPYASSLGDDILVVGNQVGSCA